MARVLVIDDDPLLREVAQEMLIQAGHEVTLAENGLVALRLPDAPAPDLAIVDMLMPERDGVETIGDLKRRWPATKLVAVSAGARGLTPQLLLKMAETLGVHATLAKPLEQASFIAVVDRLLG
jgi:two-component system, chemotaxis family, chemotaxis protein CheY